MLKNLTSKIHKRLECLQNSSQAVLFSGFITAFICAVAACVLSVYLLFRGTDFFLHAVLTQSIYSAMQVMTLTVLIIFIIEMNCYLKGK